MINSKNEAETVALSFVVFIAIAGFLLSHFNLEGFDIFYRDDSYTEWIDVTSFLIISFTYFTRAFKTHKRISSKSILLSILGCLFLIYAGEEISYGQRILGFETPDFFMQHHYHQMMNIHTLYVGDLLGIGILGDIGEWEYFFHTAVVSVYFLILPSLLQRQRFYWLKEKLDYFSISVPKKNQTSVYCILFLLACLSSINPLEKGQPLQCSITAMFAIATLFPRKISTEP